VFDSDDLGYVELKLPDVPLELQASVLVDVLSAKLAIRIARTFMRQDLVAARRRLVGLLSSERSV